MAEFLLQLVDADKRALEYGMISLRPTKVGGNFHLTPRRKRGSQSIQMVLNASFKTPLRFS
jgi:hypothetical protein